MGFLSAVEMAGFVIGPFMGGMLYSLGGLDLPFLSCSILGFAAAAMIWGSIQRDRPQKEPVRMSFWERYGFTALHHPDMKRLCLIGFSEAFIWGSIMTLLPVMASNQGVQPNKIGWLFTAYFIVYMLLLGPAGRWSDRHGRKKPILFGLCIYALSAILISRGGGFVQMMMVLAMAGFGLGIYSPCVRVAVADLSAREIRGASMGLFFTSRTMGIFMGPNISGFLADRFGPGFPFLIGSAGLLFGIWASLSLSAELSLRLAKEIEASGKKTMKLQKYPYAE